MGKKRNECGILVGSQKERKKPLGRHSWEDNIKMVLREIELGRMEWIDLVEDRDEWKALVNRAVYLRVP
jgi:hypothetical protein